MCSKVWINGDIITSIIRTITITIAVINIITTRHGTDFCWAQLQQKQEVTPSSVLALTYKLYVNALEILLVLLDCKFKYIVSGIFRVCWTKKYKNDSARIKCLQKCLQKSLRECVYTCTQSCPTLCGPMDCSPPGSSVHVLPFPSPGGSSQPRDQTYVSYFSCIGRWIFFFFKHCATREAFWNL